jgi:hypothetical protein
MTIQDIIIAAANVLFSAFLVPTLLSKSARVPLVTSATTGAVLVVEAVVFLSLGLPFSFVTTLVSGALWLSIAAFRHPGPAGGGAQPQADGAEQQEVWTPAKAPDPEWIDYWMTVRRTITDLDQRIQMYEIQMYTILSFLALLAFTLTRLIPTNLYALALSAIAEGVAISGIGISIAILLRALHFVKLLGAAVETGMRVERQMFGGSMNGALGPLLLTCNLSSRATQEGERDTVVLVCASFIAIFVALGIIAYLRPGL